MASFSPGGELVGVAGVDVGDDHGVEYVVVQAAKAEFREGAEAGGAQMEQDVIVAGGSVVVCAAGPGGGDPHQAAPLVGEGEEAQAVRRCLPEQFLRSAFPVRRWVWTRVPSIRTTSPP